MLDTKQNEAGTANLQALGVTSALAVVGSQSGFIQETHRRRNVEVLTGYAEMQRLESVATPNWGLLIRRDLNEVLQSIHSLLLQIGIIGLSVFTPLIGLLLWGSRRLLQSQALANEAIMRTQKTEKRFRHVVEAAPSGMIMIDHTGTIVLANTIMCEQFGYDSNSLLGRSIETLIPERFRSQHPSHRTQFFATPEPRSMGSGRELFGLRQDGSEFPVEIGLNPLTTDEGTFVLASVVDISARKMANEALAKYIDDLRRSNLELEQFAYVASHDLQEPLRKIRNFSELLGSRAKGHLPPEAERYLTPIVEGAIRMQTLVQDLLAYSRVARGELNVETINLQEIVEQARNNLEAVIMESQATLTIGALPNLEANPIQMEQLFQNLIGNGLKYRGENTPHIEVAAKQKAGYWEFSIRDNGIGIDPEYSDRIFVIFQRLHTKQEYAGTGIGLSICKKIVELHGGKIWVESSPHEGSTFFFTLPETQPHAQRQHHQLRQEQG